jgi:hypothetical protein
MQISKRVIQLAKERALFGFSMLAQNMVSEARYNLQRPPQSVRTAADSSALNEAAGFVSRQGNEFAARLQTYYGDYLDRAMQTMYRDLRTGLHNMSADKLSLIDDDTMNRQIEVDRLVVRMRDVDQENLGRLNLIIAQLHGDHEVKERENPFRPYLLARTLHEVIKQTLRNEVAGRLLFDAMAEVMISRLPGFYAAIREVFEANGVRSRLVAKPASLTRRQRELMRQRAANPDCDEGMFAIAAEDPAHDGESAARIQTGLRSMLDLQKTQERQEGAVPGMPDPRRRALAFQEFVWNVFDQKRPVPMPRASVAAAAREPAAEPVDETSRTSAPAVSADLWAHLLDMQKEAAARGAGSDERGRLAEVRARFAQSAITTEERLTIDVVALLFEYIFRDRHIPVDMRNEIGRLQVPFLRAALLAPELLKKAGHPARRLLNRIGAIAASIDMSQPADREVSAEISATIGRVLEQFEEDATVLAACCDRFEEFLQRIYRNRDDDTGRLVDAIEEAERASVMLYGYRNTLRDLLPPLDIDHRVTAFIMDTWARVMAILMVRNAGDESLVNQYRVILPELVWSVQSGHTMQERSLLMHMLPELVKRLKKGMELACVPESESAEALDRLADVHMQVLRAAGRQSGKKNLSVQDLYQHFSMMQVCEGSYLWVENEPLPVMTATVRAALDSRDAEADLEIRSEPIPPLAVDEEWMAQMQLGIGAEVEMDKEFELARLAWVSEQRSLFMFVEEESGLPIIYSAISLLKALRDGALRPLEYAPLFDRAVESLMEGAEALQAGA